MQPASPRQSAATSHHLPAGHDLAAGLLVVLQQAAMLRLALAALAITVYWQGLADSGRMLLVLAAGERFLLLALVIIPGVRTGLGRWFLPLMLAWLLAAPQVEWAVSLQLASTGVAQFPQTPFAASETISPIWLVVPVALAAWQYQRSGLRVTLAALLVGHILIAATPAGRASLASITLISASRLAMLFLLGYVVGRLSEAQQAEETALQQANRQLAQRAATVEQLAESRERNRLARDLHDTLAHSLTGLSVQLQALETVMTSDDTQAAAVQLRAAQTTVRDGLKEARRAIQALRATPIEDLGLVQALRDLCRAQADRTGVSISCDIADIPAPDPLTEQAIYRIAAAALANIEQHAAASTVSVTLRGEGAGRLHMTIADDGIGFDPAAVPADRFGLAGMAERAALIGAVLTIVSTPGRGTRIELATAG